MNQELFNRIRVCIKTQNPLLDLGDLDFKNKDFEHRLIYDALGECQCVTTLLLAGSARDMETGEPIVTRRPHFYSRMTSNLRRIPRAIAQMTNLSTLICPGFNLDSISVLESLAHLTYLDLSTNEISDISVLRNLKALKKVDLRNNRIEQIEGLESLTDLQYLSLSRNRISNLIPLEKLLNLTSLNLNSNTIGHLSPLSGLSNLKRLFLSGNQIAEIEPLSSLKLIEHFELANNLIQNLSPLGNNAFLRILNLSNNRIIDVNPLKQLDQLKFLDLSNNEIASIEPLLELKHRIELFVRGNKIGALSLEEYKAFFYFDISQDEHYVTAIETVKNQKNNVVRNQRYEEAARLRDIERLLIAQKNHEQKPVPIISKNDRLEIENWFLEQRILGNPITEPPIEMLTQGSESVLHYYSQLSKRGVKYLYEAKMLIVGQPRSGKTSLRYKLHDSQRQLPQEEETTRGIDIERLQFEIVDKEGKKRPFFYNVWDFGGQQIYQTTHQFFLSHRSLYILVLDTGKDSIGNDDTTINYWLQTIELLGDNSPVLLVKNEKNERQVNIDLHQKRSRFGFIKRDFNIDFNALIRGTPSYNTGREKDFFTLKKEIESELQNLPLVGFSMPTNWVEIREELEKLSRELPSISRQDYTSLCARNGVTEFDRQMELSRIFHDLGVFLHFQDHAALEDFIILQNVWATDAVFAVFDNEAVKSATGKFTDTDLPKIWEKGYPKAVHKKLLALMMKFELCYQVDKTKWPVYIVPEMLPDSVMPGYTWIPNQDLPLQYHYEFMPKGLLARLIVRLNTFIADGHGQQCVWKTGVKIDGKQLDCPDTFAEIIEAWDNKQLLIRAQGSFSKELMSKLTSEIDILNNDVFKQLGGPSSKKISRWSKMIPCICKSCEGNPNKHFHNYSNLLERKSFGKRTIECPRPPYEIVEITKLLDGIFVGEQAAGNEAPVIFISYSHLDEVWKDDLVKHLSSLRNQGLISDWHDRKIEAGIWEPQIEDAMNRSDIFILLITHNFLASEYISTKEITTAYNRYESGKSKIFPVICDSCEWQLQPITKIKKEYHPVEKRELYPWLGKFQPFPKDGKPLKNWGNVQDGFLDVITQLKNCIRE